MRVFDADEHMPVSALAFAPDARQLAVGVVVRGTALHDVAGVRPPVWLRHDGGAADRALAFAADGARAAGLTGTGRAVFDTTTGARVETGPADPAGGARAVGFAEAGARLATAHQIMGDEAVWFNGWAAGELGWEWRWRADEPGASYPVVTAAGDRVVYLAPRGAGGVRLVVRAADTGAEVATRPYPFRQYARLAVAPTGRQVVGALDKTLLVWDVRVPGPPARVRVGRRIDFVAYHPSGRYLFSTGRDGTATVWDTDSWARVRRFDWEIGRLRAVAVSPDGLLAAAGSDRGRVVVWDVDV